MDSELQGMDAFVNPDFFENDEGHIDFMFSFNNEPVVASPVSTASENSQQLDEPGSMAKWASENETALNGFLGDVKYDFTAAYPLDEEVAAPGAYETLSLGAFDYAAMLDNQVAANTTDILNGASVADFGITDEQYGTLAYANNMVGAWASQATAFPVVAQNDPSPIVSPATGISSPLSPVSASVSPADLVIRTPETTKRKFSVDSDAEVTSVPAKRGRKASANSTAKAPRQIKAEGSPLARTVTMAAEFGVPSAASSPQSGSPIAPINPAHARPKSVVPDKFLKNGTAQKILGMAEQEIKGYAQFSDILQVLVGTDRYDEAVKFGTQLEEIRLQGRDAAKKSRDEKRQQKEALMKLQAELDHERAATKARNEQVASQLAKLVGAGLLTREQAAAVIA